MKKVAIVIINYNGLENTMECLGSVVKDSYKDKIIVVVDNGSKDGSVKDIKNNFSKVIILENKENLGFSGGNNIGIKYSLEQGCKYIVLLNNDTVIDKNLVTELVKSFEKDDNMGIVSPKIYFEKGFEFYKDRYRKEDMGKVLWYAGGVMDWKNLIASHRGVDEVDIGQYDKEEETDFATGCCMMIKREVFEKIGFFDEKYFLYFEDGDFIERAKKAKFKIVYSPKGVLWHKNAGSSGSGSFLHDYYLTRNRLIFGLKYTNFKTRLALIRESIRLIFSGRKWQKKAVFDFYSNNLGRGSYE